MHRHSTRGPRVSSYENRTLSLCTLARQCLLVDGMLCLFSTYIGQCNFLLFTELEDSSMKSRQILSRDEDFFLQLDRCPLYLNAKGKQTNQTLYSMLGFRPSLVSGLEISSLSKCLFVNKALISA